MRNNKTKIASAGLIFIVMLSSLLLLVNPGLADDHHKFKGWFEKEERDHLSIFNTQNR
jgi:hypothetical protein